MVCPSHVFVDQHPASGRGSPDVTLWPLSGQLSSVCSLFLELLCPGPCALVLSDQGVQQTLLVSTPCAPAWTASPGASCVVQGSPSSDPSSRISVFCCTRLFVSKALFHGCILQPLVVPGVRLNPTLLTQSCLPTGHSLGTSSLRA